MDFRGFANAYNISNNTLEFLEWCDRRITIDKLTTTEFTSYKQLAEILGLKVPTNTSTKEKQIESLKVFCDIEQINRTRIRITNKRKPEFAEYHGSTYGVYQEIFNLLFKDWIETKDVYQFYYPTEKVALEMGLLKHRYSGLNRKDFQNDFDYKLIRDSDYAKRIKGLIWDQLSKLQKTSDKRYALHRVSRADVFYKLEDRSDECGSYKEIVPLNEMENDELINMLAKKQLFLRSTTEDEEDSTVVLTEHARKEIAFKSKYPEYTNVMRMWKIARPSSPGYIPLDSDFKELLIWILLHHKQEKMYYDVHGYQGIKAPAPIDIEDENDMDAWRFRINLFNAEQSWDGFSIYEEYDVDFYPFYGNKDYKRNISGKKIDAQREEVKSNVKRKPRPKF